MIQQGLRQRLFQAYERVFPRTQVPRLPLRPRDKVAHRKVQARPRNDLEGPKVCVEVTTLMNLLIQVLA